MWLTVSFIAGNFDRVKKVCQKNIWHQYERLKNNTCKNNLPLAIHLERLGKVLLRGFWILVLGILVSVMTIDHHLSWWIVRRSLPVLMKREKDWPSATRRHPILSTIICWHLVFFRLPSLFSSLGGNWFFRKSSPPSLLFSCKLCYRKSSNTAELICDTIAWNSKHDINVSLLCV